MSGGDVNEAYRIETDTDTFFLLVQRGRKEIILCCRNCRFK
ncbi:hypothetical protein ACVQ92_09480 [Staphylococcus aureus]